MAKNYLLKALTSNKPILRIISNFTLAHQIFIDFMKTYKLLNLCVSLLQTSNLCQSLTLLHLTHDKALSTWSCVFTYQETQLFELLLTSSLQPPSYTCACTYLSQLICLPLFEISHPFSVLSWNQFLCTIVYFLQPRLCRIMTSAHSQQPTTYHSHTRQLYVTHTN